MKTSRNCSGYTSAESRRSFLKKSTILAGGVALSQIPLARSAHAAGSDVIRIGLVGCGSRGTAAAINAMNAGKDVQLVAMADIFESRLKESRDKLKGAKAAQFAVKDDRCFIGFDGYARLLASGVDAVVIAPASHFIPQVLMASIEAGKHVFCEKPHGIDMPGIKQCQAAAEKAKGKKLSVVSGLCWRYAPAVQETMKRVQDGAIGDILAIQETYVSAPYFPRERQPGHTEMQHQMWNWYHFNWLSGDQTGQQLIHSLDKASWALGDKPPERLWGMGGRQTCVDPVYGDQFDHQAVVFEYPNGVRVYGYTRDQKDCFTNTSDYIIGTKGRCDLLKFNITGQTNWQYEGPKENMYDVEHRKLFESIRTGEPINNGHYMCLSSALALGAQIACYSGALLTWEQVMSSKRSFALPRYGWDVEPPVKPARDGRYPAPLQGKEELAKWLMS